MRPGDNKWTAGVFARDLRTGQARWFYQSSPHDLFDHDDINEGLLLDLPIGGQMRKVIARPGRTGFFYVIDRLTGQVLSAEPYAYVNSIKKIDLTTGRPQMAADKLPKAGRSNRVPPLEVLHGAPGAGVFTGPVAGRRVGHRQ
jgi:lanthanide-dependent methanol dehydrogenase